MSGSVVCQPALKIPLNEHLAMSFQLIPAGSFRMGSRHQYANEEPIHQVRITRPFYLGTFPVTQEEFAVWTSSASRMGLPARLQADLQARPGAETSLEHQNHFSDRPKCPAESMTWHHAQGFCQWLSTAAQFPQDCVATLPSEAEWEYACRAGTETEYYTGDGVAALAQAGWFYENSEKQTQPVGQLAANDFGLYDMHGNVWEWCRDAWDANVYKKRVDNVADPEVRASDTGDEDRHRVIRGGAWLYSAWYCRSAFRNWWRPGIRLGLQGFRVCLVPGPVTEQPVDSETES